tara:strand:+ start:389 stop:616 length:228 start_codon:yes stop_codon:yes gene_type:complete
MNEIMAKHFRSLIITVLGAVLGFVVTQVLPGLEKHPEYGALIGSFSGYAINLAKLGIQALAIYWGVAAQQEEPKQ